MSTQPVDPAEASSPEEILGDTHVDEVLPDYDDIMEKTDLLEVSDKESMDKQLVDNALSTATANVSLTENNTSAQPGLGKENVPPQLKETEDIYKFTDQETAIPILRQRPKPKMTTRVLRYFQDKENKDVPQTPRADRKRKIRKDKLAPKKIDFTKIQKQLTTPTRKETTPIRLKLSELKNYDNFKKETISQIVQQLDCTDVTSLETELIIKDEKIKEEETGMDTDTSVGATTNAKKAQPPSTVSVDFTDSEVEVLLASSSSDEGSPTTVTSEKTKLCPLSTPTCGDSRTQSFLEKMREKIREARPKTPAPPHLAPFGGFSTMPNVFQTPSGFGQSFSQVSHPLGTNIPPPWYTTPRQGISYPITPFTPTWMAYQHLVPSPVARPTITPTQVTPAFNYPTNSPLGSTTIYLTEDLRTRLTHHRHLSLVAGHFPQWRLLTLDDSPRNSYADTCQRILWRIFGNQTVDLTDYTLLTYQFGHLVAHKLDIQRKKEMLQAQTVSGTIDEIDKGSPLGLCKNCNSTHFQFENQCPAPMDNFSGNGLDNPNWRTLAKCVVIGWTSLTNLPTDTKGKIVNLSCPTVPGYQICGADQMTDSFIRGQPLYRFLLRKLLFIGLDNPLPVFVEFTTSKEAPSCSRQYNHAITFLTIVKRAQEDYAGPIVVITPPTNYRPGLTWEEYTDEKTRIRMQGHCIHIIGQAIGVGTYDLWINACPAGTNTIIRKTWNLVPLYNHSGATSREYQRRLTEKMTELVSSLETILVPGQRRRRGLTEAQSAQLVKDYSWLPTFE